MLEIPTTEWTQSTVHFLPGAPLSMRRAHPKTMGIYFLLEDGNLQYIGSSVNLQARLDGHKSSRRWATDATARWLLFDHVSRGEMLEVEHELIYRLRPPKNVTMNPASSKVQSYVAGNIRSIWVKRIVEKMTTYQESSAGDAKGL